MITNTTERKEDPSFDRQRRTTYDGDAPPPNQNVKIKEEE